MARSDAPLSHDLWGAWALVMSWGPIALALALFHARPSALTFAVAFAVVAARQHAMFVVAHESFHGNLFRARGLNDGAGAWLAAYPIIMAWGAAKEGHWNHHREFPGEADPDRYAWDWRVDQRGAFVRYLLFTLTGLPFVLRSLAAALGRDVPAFGRPIRRAAGGAGKGELLRVILTHGALLAAFTVTLGAPYYFALWLAPAVSLRVALDETRQFLEHRDGTIAVYRAGPVERFFLGPFNFHLHGVHHAIASEPWFRLAAAEEAARAKADILEKRSYARELVRFFRGVRGDA